VQQIHRQRNKRPSKGKFRVLYRLFETNV
jgi:hypothetical protein